MMVNYDPDTAGQAATERSLSLLLEQNCDVRVLALPGGKDPDAFIRGEGAEAYRKLLEAAPAYLDYLIGRAQQMGVANAEEKLRAMNFLMPFVQRHAERAFAFGMGVAYRAATARGRAGAARGIAPGRGGTPQRGEDATRARGPRGETRGAATGADADGAERLSRAVEEEIRAHELHMGLETEKILGVLIEACAAGATPDANALAPKLEEQDRRLLFEIAFEGGMEASWEEAESCLEVLRRRKAEEELAAVQRQIEACGAGVGDGGEQLRELQVRYLELRRRLASAAP